MRRVALPVVLLAALLAGATYPFTVSSTTSNDAVDIEVPFGAAAAGVSTGANRTNASVTIARALTLLTSTPLYLNNTNATGAYYARIEQTGNNGQLSRILTLEVGIDNGTRTSQVAVSAGTLTSATGSYVKLEPGSVNTIFVSQLFLNAGGADPSFALDVYVADDPSESAFTVTRMTLDLV